MTTALMTTPMTTALTTTLMGTAQAAVLRLIAAPVDFPGEKVPDSAQINLIPNLGGVRLLRNLFHHMNEGRSIEQLNWTVQYFYPHSISKTLVLSGFSHIFLCPPDGQPMTKSLKFILKNEEIAVLNPLSKSACGFFFALMDRLKLVWGFVI